MLDLKEMVQQKFSIKTVTSYEISSFKQWRTDVDAIKGANSHSTDLSIKKEKLNPSKKLLV